MLLCTYWNEPKSKIIYYVVYKVIECLGERNRIKGTAHVCMKKSVITDTSKYLVTEIEHLGLVMMH